MSNQAGFFDLSDRKAKLLAKKDFLESLKGHVKWEQFRPLLDAALKRSERLKGGRPPHDALLMLKIIILQSLYNLSDEQIEYQILDRLSFMRFLGLDLHDKVPDEKTIWVFREQLSEAGAVDKLFAKFNDMLVEQGLRASGGQMIDATFVEVPKQRNTKDENKHIKETNTAPSAWNMRKKAQKDVHARWTKKNDVSYFGYKNHANIDVKHKLIRAYKVTPASVHDSVEMNNILDKTNDKPDIWADSAYRSEAQEKHLKRAFYVSHIHERAYKNAPLSEDQKTNNRNKSTIRVRCEHVFGHIEVAMNGCFVRTIGLARATIKIGLECLAYNMSRLQTLMKQKENKTIVKA
jgi:transposase, IS5 family